MFLLQIKDGTKPHQASPRCMSYVFEQSFKDQLGCLPEQKIVIHIGVNIASEWHNRFVQVSKPKEKLRLCLDPLKLNYVFIRPVCSLPDQDVFICGVNQENGQLSYLWCNIAPINYYPCWYIIMGSEWFFLLHFPFLLILPLIIIHSVLP